VNNSKSALKVGVFTFIALILIAVLMIWQSGIFLRATGYQLIGEFNDVNGLLDGSVVRYRGYKVGNVEKIIPGPKSIKVYFWLESHIKIPTESKLRIIFDGLIGEKFLDIKAHPENKTILAPGSILPGYATSGLADFVDIGTQNLEQSKAILEALRNIITSDEFSKSIKETFSGIALITKDLAEVSLELRQFAESSNMQEIAKNISDVASSLKKTTDAVLKDGKTAAEIKNIIINFSEMSNNLKVLTANVDYEKLNTTIENLSEFTGELKSLLQDPELKDDLRGTIKESKKMFAQTSNLLEGFSYLTPGYAFEGKYYGLDSDFYYIANMNIGYKQNYIRIGIGDELGSNIILNFQGGFYLMEKLNARLGLFNTYPGLGLDYRIIQNMLLSFDMYNFNRENYVQLDLDSRVYLLNNLDLIVSFDDVLQHSYKNWAVGFSFHTRYYK
jgi:ABC-type transporter Mla subunit MlaD